MAMKKQSLDSRGTAPNHRSDERADDASLSLVMRELLLRFVEPTAAGGFDPEKYAATGRG
jgi:hypothetical protein